MNPIIRQKSELEMTTTGNWPQGSSKSVASAFNGKMTPPPRNCPHFSHPQSAMFIPRRELLKKKHLWKRKRRPMSRLVWASLGGSLLWFQLGTKECDPPGRSSTRKCSFILWLLPASQEPSQCSTVLFTVPCAQCLWKKIIHSCPINYWLAMWPALARKMWVAERKHYKSVQTTSSFLSAVRSTIFQRKAATPTGIPEWRCPGVEW